MPIVDEFPFPFTAVSQCLSSDAADTLEEVLECAWDLSLKKAEILWNHAGDRNCAPVRRSPDKPLAPWVMEMNQLVVERVKFFAVAEGILENSLLPKERRPTGLKKVGGTAFGETNLAGRLAFALSAWMEKTADFRVGGKWREEAKEWYDIVDGLVDECIADLGTSRRTQVDFMKITREIAG